MNFSETDDFVKDFKRLSKKYLSLTDDLLEFKKVVSQFPLGVGKHFALLTQQGTVNIVRARLFCRYLRGSSLRIIYAYHNDKMHIDFIELYYKGAQATETRSRIVAYLKHIRSLG